MRAIYHKRSQLKNWKMKKYHQRGGGVYYTVWKRSIFGWWRSNRTPSEFPDGWSERTIYHSLEDARDAIRDGVRNNVTMLGTTVKEVEEIKFR